MILDTTHANKDQTQLINDLVGKPFGLMQSIKMKGIGSKRMMIADVSPNMKHYLNSIDDINYANLELRPIGVLIRINKGLKNYTWVIPYYQLVIYKTNGSSIHAQGKFIQFRQNTTFKENKAFFDKLLDEKVKYEAEFNILP
ncbi:hypothetical protein LX77_00210 [Gelidibacter algens]|jgi:hypothetical protein|uniref:Uncharacterized protein n=1 Tax=Gelidibacter algens TaxID=49280 RepID=A0A1A7QUH0_9FLAO|nr:hypothetical protein [Gelidibacter algens]OBX22869.1 hypothetical protein A9996_16520 [Gelidibacter algens]RAJ27637.1 hypothetical protein LX77_00210 [Gelidibacter algens]